MGNKKGWESAAGKQLLPNPCVLLRFGHVIGAGYNKERHKGKDRRGIDGLCTIEVAVLGPV